MSPDAEAIRFGLELAVFLGAFVAVAWKARGVLARVDTKINGVRAHSEKTAARLDDHITATHRRIGELSRRSP